ncbi:MAG: Ig-like domain-containing protein, partial [Proteiniphilum sp.]
MKKWLVFMLVFVLAFVIVGCKEDPVIEDVLVTGVTADVTEKEIAVGEKFIIKATIAPANATDKTVTFASDKTTVATVNSTTGEVSGVAPGEAVITVSATNDKTATVTVTVVEATVEVTGVTVIDATKTLEVGEKHQIVATVAPANATDKSVSYTSSDATVATVSEDGEVEALKVGTATIIVKTANNLTATVGITVIADSSVLAITNAPAEEAVVVEDVYKLEANQTGTITWVSKDETIATVDAEGNVTAVAEGTVIIEATLGDETVQVTIVIGAKEDNTFKLTAPEDRTEFAVDFSLTLTASKGDLVLSAETTFEVTMDPEGAVEYEVQEDSLGNSLHKIRLDALLPGTATVKATNGDDVAEYVVTIIERPEPESFEITGNLEIELGNQATMRVANVLPLYAKRTVTWSISDELVATIDPETGVVTPVAEGTVTVTATYTENAEIFATLEIAIIPEKIIEPEYVDPEEIFVNGYESIYIDETYQFTASVAPAGASQDVIWTISPETIATITENGKVTGVGLGTANILVKAEKEDGTFVTARFRVTVTEAPVVPDPENLGGYVITIMNAAQALSDQDPFLPEYKGLDKTYKQQAWNEVEALYNCDIQVVAYPDSAPWGPLRWAWVNENANNNTAQADFFILPSDIIDDVHASKALYDTKDLYTSFGKNSMGAGFKESVTFKDGIYGMATGTYAENYIDRGLFY